MHKGVLWLLLAAGAAIGVFYLNAPKPYRGDEIVLGQSCALSGPSAELGRGMMIGAQAWFAHLNAQGGVHGRKIRLLTLDDRYEPRLTEANTRTFIEQKKVFALFGYVGTPTTQAVLPLIETHQIPLLAPLTGAGLFRTPSHPLVVNYRAGYKTEIELIARKLKADGIKRVAVFYQNDSYGKTGLFAAREMLGKYGLLLVAEGSYNRNTLSVGHALYEIAPQAPEAVVMIDAYKPGAEFIRRARAAGMDRTLFFHISFVNSDSLFEALEEPGMENVFVTQVVPPPWDSRYAPVAQYQKILARYFPDEPYTFASLEGFLSAQRVGEGLQKCGPGLNTEAFLEALQQLQPKNENPEERVWLTAFQNGRMQTVQGKTP